MELKRGEGVDVFRKGIERCRSGVNGIIPGVQEIEGAREGMVVLLNDV